MLPSQFAYARSSAVCWPQQDCKSTIKSLCGLFVGRTVPGVTQEQRPVSGLQLGGHAMFERRAVKVEFDACEVCMVFYSELRNPVVPVRCPCSDSHGMLIFTIVFARSPSPYPPTHALTLQNADCWRKELQQGSFCAAPHGYSPWAPSLVLSPLAHQHPVRFNPATSSLDPRLGNMWKYPGQSTLEPTAAPTPAPTATPTIRPSPAPTVAPTLVPTSAPTTKKKCVEALAGRCPESRVGGGCMDCGE